MEWFDSLNRPFLAPPDWLFTPMWMVLYILLAIAFFLFVKGGMSLGKKIGLTFFFIQLVLNFMWPIIFFSYQNILLALFVLALMWFFTLLTIVFFLVYSIKAGLFLVPYFLWISFAFYLNFGYLVLN